MGILPTLTVSPPPRIWGDKAEERGGRGEEEKEEEGIL
jgi:hypothetical protein